MIIGSKVQGTNDSWVKDSEESVHLEVGQRLKEVRRVQRMKLGIFQGGLT